jgi:hypothetical protein
MTSTALPTDAELAAARDMLARAAAASAEAPRAAMIALVTMPEFAAVIDAARTAQTLNPADTEVAYVISMMERLRLAHTPR